MTTSSSTEVNRYDYDPYGQVINQQEQSGLNNPWKFAGGYLDSSTGLYKFGTRYYAPSLGRWTQQDPVGGSLGDLNAANRYTYANDDPVNVVDPSGKQISFPCWLSVPINVFEIGTAAAGLFTATLFGLPAAVVAFLSGPITAGAGITYYWPGHFFPLRFYRDCWRYRDYTGCRSNLSLSVKVR